MTAAVGCSRAISSARFGPDSAVWYVHEHLPTLILGLVGAAYIEGLDPSISWMGYDHSRLVERADGVPTGGIDPEGAAVRLGHSLSFFIGTAYGSTATAERLGGLSARMA